MSANIFSVSTVVEGNTRLRYLHMFGQHDHSGSLRVITGKICLPGLAKMIKMVAVSH